jgi:hypothetical protein
MAAKVEGARAIEAPGTDGRVIETVRPEDGLDGRDVARQGSGAVVDFIAIVVI